MDKFTAVARKQGNFDAILRCGGNELRFQSLDTGLDLEEVLDLLSDRMGFLTVAEERMVEGT